MKREELAYKLWQRVDVRREILGYTLDVLAKESGLNKQTIKDQRSRNIIPRSDTLFSIASTLRCSMEYLISGHELDSGTLLEYIPFLERCPPDRLESVRLLLGMSIEKKSDSNSGTRVG